MQAQDPSKTASSALNSPASFIRWEDYRVEEFEKADEAGRAAINNEWADQAYGAFLAKDNGKWLENPENFAKATQYVSQKTGLPQDDFTPWAEATKQAFSGQPDAVVDIMSNEDTDLTPLLATGQAPARTALVKRMIANPQRALETPGLSVREKAFLKSQMPVISKMRVGMAADEAAQDPELQNYVNAVFDASEILGFNTGTTTDAFNFGRDPATGKWTPKQKVNALAKLGQGALFGGGASEGEVERVAETLKAKYQFSDEEAKAALDLAFKRVMPTDFAPIGKFSYDKETGLPDANVRYEKDTGRVTLGQDAMTASTPKLEELLSSFSDAELPKEAREQAKEINKVVREATYEQQLPTLLKNDSAFAAHFAKTWRENPDLPQSEVAVKAVDTYERGLGRAIADVSINALSDGVVSLAASGLAIPGMFGSRTLSDMASGMQKYTQERKQTRQALGQGDVAAFTSDLVELVPQLYAQVKIGQLAGSVAASRSAAAVAQSLNLPKAAVLGAAEVGAASNAAAFRAAVGTAAAQSAGSTYASEYGRIKEALVASGMDEESATDKAMSDARIPALAAGLTTGIITKAFGATGVEALTQKGGAAKVTIRDLFGDTPAAWMAAEQGIRSVLKPMLKTAYEGFQSEFKEEALDQFVQGLTQAATTRPDTTLGDIVKDSLYAGALGGFAGGAAISFTPGGADAEDLAAMQKVAQERGNTQAKIAANDLAKSGAPETAKAVAEVADALPPPEVKPPLEVTPRSREELTRAAQTEETLQGSPAAPQVGQTVRFSAPTTFGETVEGVIERIDPETGKPVIRSGKVLHRNATLAEAPVAAPKTRLDLVLDEVDKTGEVRIDTGKDVSSETLSRVEKAASARGMTAAFDGSGILVRKAPTLEPTQAPAAPKAKRQRKAQPATPSPATAPGTTETAASLPAGPTPPTPGGVGLGVPTQGRQVAEEGVPTTAPTESRDFADGIANGSVGDSPSRGQSTSAAVLGGLDNMRKAVSVSLDPRATSRVKDYWRGWVTGRVDSRNSISAEAVDAYGIQLPDGYVRQGDLYVFQPEGTAPLSPEGPTQPAPTGVQPDTTDEQQMPQMQGREEIPQRDAETTQVTPTPEPEMGATTEPTVETPAPVAEAAPEPQAPAQTEAQRVATTLTGLSPDNGTAAAEIEAALSDPDGPDVARLKGGLDSDAETRNPEGVTRRRANLREHGIAPGRYPAKLLIQKVIAAGKLNPQVRQVVEKLLSNIDGDIVVVEAENGFRPDMAAAYVPPRNPDTGAGLVVVNLDQSSDPTGGAVIDALHEVVHHALRRAMAKPELRKYWDVWRTKLGEAIRARYGPMDPKRPMAPEYAAKMHYISYATGVAQVPGHEGLAAAGRGNPDEMITGLLNSPELQNILARFDKDGNVPAGWRRALVVINRMLGRKTSGVTLLDDTLDKMVRLSRLKSAGYGINAPGEDLANRASVTAVPGTESYPTESGADLVGPALFSIAAFHGTPHKVDRFDVSRIGTGEGKQAYGWGLYMASSREVAESYRNKLSGNYKPGQLLDIQLRAKQRTVDSWKAAYEAQPNEANLNQLRLAESELARAKGEAGFLYTVEILAEEDELLDLDKPLSEQSKRVTDSLLSMGGEVAGISDRSQRQYYDGTTAYGSAINQFGDARAASNALAAAGIKGIRYLDGNSRTAGNGSYNYVIFNDADIRITAENGQPVQPGLQASVAAPEGGQPDTQQTYERLVNATIERANENARAVGGEREFLAGDQNTREGKVRQLIERRAGQYAPALSKLGIEFRMRLGERDARTLVEPTSDGRVAISLGGGDISPLARRGSLNDVALRVETIFDEEVIHALDSSLALKRKPGQARESLRDYATAVWDEIVSSVDALPADQADAVKGQLLDAWRLYVGERQPMVREAQDGVKSGVDSWEGVRDFASNPEFDVGYNVLSELTRQIVQVRTTGLETATWKTRTLEKLNAFLNRMIDVIRSWANKGPTLSPSWNAHLDHLTALKREVDTQLNASPGLQGSVAAPVVTPEQDAAYMDAVNRGDMETAQRMVDEAARAAGYDVGPVYHGTIASRGSFTVFRNGVTKKDAFRLAFDGLGPGWFTSSEEQAKKFGSRVVAAHLKLENPWTVYADEIAVAEHAERYRELQALKKKDRENSGKDPINGWFRDGLTFDERARMKELYSLGANEEITKGDSWEGLGKLRDEAKLTYPDLSDGEAVRQGLTDRGYDGIILEATTADGGFGVDTRVGNLWVIPFRGEGQIKSADPVTRDENGNIIPLSQRFNPLSPDIRFSVAAPEPVTITTNPAKVAVKDLARSMVALARETRTAAQVTNLKAVLEGRKERLVGKVETLLTAKNAEIKRLYKGEGVPREYLEDVRRFLGSQYTDLPDSVIDIEREATAKQIRNIMADPEMTEEQRSMAVVDANLELSRKLGQLREQGREALRNQQAEAATRLQAEQPRLYAILKDLRDRIDASSVAIRDKTGPHTPLGASIDADTGLYLTRGYSYFADPEARRTWLGFIAPDQDLSPDDPEAIRIVRNMRNYVRDNLIIKEANRMRKAERLAMMNLLAQERQRGPLARVAEAVVENPNATPETKERAQRLLESLMPWSQEEIQQGTTRPAKEMFATAQPSPLEAQATAADATPESLDGVLDALVSEAQGFRDSAQSAFEAAGIYLKERQAAIRKQANKLRKEAPDLTDAELRRAIDSEFHPLSMEEAIDLATTLVDSSSARPETNMVDAVLKQLLSRSEGGNFESFRGVALEAESIFKKRGNVPEVLQEFWGRQESNLDAAMETLLKQQKALADRQVKEELADQLLQMGLARMAQPGKPWLVGPEADAATAFNGETAVPLANLDRSPFSPWRESNYEVPLSVFQALKQAYDTDSTKDPSALLRLARHAMAMVTVGSTRGVPRNFLGGGSMAFAAGVNPLRLLSRPGIRGIRATLIDLANKFETNTPGLAKISSVDLINRWGIQPLVKAFASNMNTPEGRQDVVEYLAEMVEYGVAGQNFHVQMLNDLKKRMATGNPTKALIGWEQWLKNRSDTYQAADLPWRALKFEAELAHQMDLRGLRPEQRTEDSPEMRAAKQDASQYLLSEMPTYSELAFISKRFKAQPYVAAFISFTLARLANNVNIAGNAKRQIKATVVGSDTDGYRVALGGDAAKTVNHTFGTREEAEAALRITRARGARKMVQWLGYHATAQMLYQFLGQWIANMMTGLDLDDEDRRYMKAMLPDYLQNSLVVFTDVKRDENGVPVSFRHANLSYLFADEVIFHASLEAISQELAVNGGQYGPAFAKGLQGLLEPFVTEQPIMSSIFEAQAGQSEFGEPIWLKGDSPLEKGWQSLKWVGLKSLAPADFAMYGRFWKGIKGTEERGERYSVGNEALSLVFGTRSRQQLVDSAITNALYRVDKDMLSFSRQKFGSILKKSSELDPDDLAAAYERFDTEYGRGIQKLRLVRKAALKLGVPEAKFNAQMKELNISEDLRRLISDPRRPVKLPVSDETIRKAREMERKNKDGRLEALRRVQALP